MKKLLFVLILCLAAVLLVSCGNDESPVTEIPETPPAPVATVGLEYAMVDGSDGCAVIGYKGDDTDIIVPDEVNGIKVVAIGDNAFRANDKITSVSLGANVKNIGVAAFAGCDSLGEVSLGDSLEKIAVAAFFGCKQLKTAELPSSVKLIGLDAFGACGAIDVINYDGNQSMWSRVEVAMGNDVFNTELVLAEGGALVKLIASGDCNANINWRLGYDGILYVTGNGHIPDYAFDKTPWGEYVDSITAIVVEDGIDVVGKNCFIGCVKAESVTLAPSVRLIDNGAFYNCSALMEITLPERLRRIGDSAFFGCTSLEAIEIPDSVTAMGSGAFMGCLALESVKLSSAVTDIERWSFAECVSLKSIDLSAVNYVANSAFLRCSLLSAVTVGANLIEVGDNAFLDCPRISLTGALNPSAVIGSGNMSFKK